MLITEVCQEEARFKPMADLPELQGLTIEDVLSFSEDEFVDSLPAAHRLRSKILYRQLAAAPPPSDVVDLSGKAFGRAMGGGDNTLANLLSVATPDMFANATRILLRNNYLVDADGPNILRLVDLICESAGGGRVTLDLCGNRFSPGILPTLATIMDKQCIKYVVVPEIGHVGAKHELNKLHKVSFFEKLIFIPRHHLAGGGWKALIDDVKDQNQIQEAHRLYFEL